MFDCPPVSFQSSANMATANELRKKWDIVVDMWNRTTAERLAALAEITAAVLEFRGNDTAFNAFWRSFNVDASWTTKTQTANRLYAKAADIAEYAKRSVSAT